MKTNTTIDTLLKIRERIRDINLKIDEEPIPTSDIIFRKILIDLVPTEDMCLYYLNLLNEASFIFTIHIVEPDEILKIPGIYGYVVSEKEILESLLKEYNRKLEYIYEIEKRKKAGAETIIRELMPRVKEYNNTALGKALNICLMLDQFIRIINEKPDNFTDEYRLNRLKQLLPEEKNDVPIEEKSEVHEQKVKQEFRRAVDTEEYKELAKMNLAGNWGKAVQKFGVQFLIRVHLRKLEFDILKKLILQKRIAREEDLIYLRDALRKIEERALFDRDVSRFLPQIRELKRIAQLKINQFYLIRKKYEG